MSRGRRSICAAIDDNDDDDDDDDDGGGGGGGGGGGTTKNGSIDHFPASIGSNFADVRCFGNIIT